MPKVADLVLDALEMPERAPEEPREVLLGDERDLEIADILPYVENAQTAAQGGKNIWHAAALLVAVCERSMMAEPEEGFLAFLFDAREAELGGSAALARLQSSLQSFQKILEEDLYREARDATLWGWHGYIDFIQEIWGEATAELLQKITGASQATVRRWLDGGGAGAANTRTVADAARAFYELQHRAGWSSERVRSWAHSPVKGSRDTPADLFCRRSPYRQNLEIAVEIRRQLSA